LPGLAIATLGNVQFEPGFLHSMQIVVAWREALDCLYRATPDRRHWHAAGSGGITVEMHDAGPAQAHTTAKFRAGESEVIPQHPKQGRVPIAVECHGLIVDRKRDHLSTSRLY
jgi:hypothetical protein